jgi:hypothetical protein
VRVSLVLALAVVLLSSPAFAESIPLVLSVDASPGRLQGTDSWLQPPGVALIGSMAANALDRKAAEIGAELGAALPFDLLDEAARELTVPEPLGGAAAQFVALRATNGEAITKLLAERGWREALHVRYIAVLNVIQSEIAASFAELSALWARIAEDAAGGVDPQTKWANLPGMPKDPDVWLRCKPSTTCRDQHLLQLTESRAWIASGQGPVVASIDRHMSAAANFIVIPIPAGTP